MIPGEVRGVELAKLLKLTDRRIQQLAEMGVVVKKLRGKYALEESVQGYIQYLIDQERQKPLDKDKEDARYKAAKADLAELEYAVKTGILLHKDAVEDMWAKVIFALRARLLSMDSKLVNKVFGLKRKAETKKAIRDYAHKLLREMSAIEVGNSSAHADTGGPGKDSTVEAGAAAEPDGQ